jgi:phosphopantetheine--protein transferase-like protein
VIHGVGVDLVHLDRFARFARENRAGVSDLFGPAERSAFRGTRALAEAWAMKEATLKAVGGLAGWDVDWKEIRASRRTGGVRVRLSGAVAAHARRVGAGAIVVTTSWTRDAVVAAVIAQGR